MKTLITGILMLSISGCAFVKQVQTHCTVTAPSYNLQNGDFTSCIQCDSLAAVVKSVINKVK
ncbi:hypothetical protein UFOVP1106_38 [uncultured Caudovirales phage]|uniref:Lipoprotein n=1 Tax=uncultured Caudovirales phage TaxID=2100421 RepID=A0A6J5QRN0_9CAUD|nr:hypothetical protein UFOVP1106_38 [uncultured Caudovirales phage]